MSIDLNSLAGGQTVTAYHPVEPIGDQCGAPNATDEFLLDSISINDTVHDKPVDVRAKRRGSILRDWWQEIIAVVLSTITLAAVIGILYPHDRQPLPEWPYSISVNTLISIYAVVFKASILFAVTAMLGQLKWLWYRKDKPLHHLDIYDQASRGPLGSSKFLWSIGYHDVLASAGSIVILLMVVLDPFTQLLLSTYDDVWHVSNETSIVRTSFLDTLGSDSIHVGASISSVPPRWQNAINAGLFTGAESIPVTCATGNCTYPGSYATVGFCSNCRDISDQLKIVNQTFVDNEGLRPFNNWGFNASLPSGFSIFNEAYTGYKINWTGTRATKDWAIEIILTPSPILGVETEFARIFNLDRSACTSSRTNTPWWCRAYGAATCNVSPCVKRLDGSMVFGTLNETILATSPLDQWGSGNKEAVTYRSMVDLSCTTPPERSQLQDIGYRFSADQTWLAYNISLAPDRENFDTFSKSLLAHGCLFVYHWDAVFSLWTAYLMDFFDGKLASNVGPQTDSKELFGPQYLQQIFNWGNITFERVSAIFNNISDSLTTVTRQAGSQNYSSPVVGIVMRDQTYLRVRWAWLSFPAALTVVVWSLLVVVLMTQNGAREVPTWKSSTLPMVLNVFVSKAPHHSDEPGSSDRMKDREVLARSIKARLVEVDGGVELVDVVGAEDK